MSLELPAFSALHMCTSCPFAHSCVLVSEGDDNQAKKKKNTKLNGYTCLLQQRMARRASLPGETKEDCRKRVFTAVQSEWRRLAPADRSQYTQMAKILNQDQATRNRLDQRQIVSAGSQPQKDAAEHNPSGTSEPADVLASYMSATDAIVISPPAKQANRVDSIVPFGGLGAMGSGDQSHALSVAMVGKLQKSSAAFVQNFANDWRKRCDGRVEETPQFKQTTQCGCHDEFKCAMCCKEIKDGILQDRIFQQLHAFVGNYRRKFLVNKKNTGPDCKVQMPLLVVRRPRRTLLCSGRHGENN